MAVPTLASVAPASGAPTGGQVVELAGSNFRLPSQPGPEIPVLPAPPSVRVFVGGTEARVDVISSSRLFVYVPKRAMPLDGVNTLGSEVVDIVVQNIDDSGVLIPGEEVTLPEAYTYVRPGISHQEGGEFLRVTRFVVELLRSEVLNNTMISTGTDFDPETGLPAIEIEQTPQLILTGPSISVNRFFTYRGSYMVAGQGNESYRRRRHRVVDLSYHVLGVTNSDVELINLQALLEVVVDRNTSLFMPLDAGNTELGTIELEFHIMQDPDYDRVEAWATSDLHVFSASVLVRGFPLGVLPGVDLDAVDGVTHQITEVPVLEAPLQIGENTPAVHGAPTRSPPEQGVPSPRSWPVHGGPRRSPPEAGEQK